MLNGTFIVSCKLVKQTFPTSLCSFPDYVSMFIAVIYNIISMCSVHLTTTVKCWIFLYFVEEITRKWARKEGERHTQQAHPVFFTFSLPYVCLCFSVSLLCSPPETKWIVYLSTKHYCQFFFTHSISPSLSLTCLLWRFKKPWKFISVEITWKNNAHMRAPECFYCKQQNKKMRRFIYEWSIITLWCAIAAITIA